MADRTSAEIFGLMFETIDQHVKEPELRQTLALRFWEAQRSYDFSPYQMYVDEALENLGLAREGVDPDYPDDGPTMLYGPDGDE